MFWSDHTKFCLSPNHFSHSFFSASLNVFFSLFLPIEIFGFWLFFTTPFKITCVLAEICIYFLSVCNLQTNRSTEYQNFKQYSKEKFQFRLNRWISICFYSDKISQPLILFKRLAIVVRLTFWSLFSLNYSNWLFSSVSFWNWQYIFAQIFFENVR